MVLETGNKPDVIPVLYVDWFTIKFKLCFDIGMKIMYISMKNVRRCGGMVDAPDSKSGEGNFVRVRVSPALPNSKK